MLARLHVFIPSPLAFGQEAGGSPEAFPVHLAETSLQRGMAEALCSTWTQRFSPPVPFPWLSLCPGVHKEAEAEEAFGSLLLCMC